MDLVSPRSSVGDAWRNQFLNIAQIIREADAIRQQYRHTGTVKDRLQELADSHGISLETLYRLCGKTPFKELSLLYLDPVYLQPHLPKTMCLWSADFAYALFLDSFQHYSQNDIFRELLKRNGFRWSPRNSAWQRQLTDNGKHAARRAMEEIAALNA